MKKRIIAISIVLTLCFITSIIGIVLTGDIQQKPPIIVSSDYNEYNNITILKTGWNLVSTFIISEIAVADLYVNYNNSIYTFDSAVTNHLLVSTIFDWDAVNQRYEISNTLYGGRGYWIYSYINCILMNKKEDAMGVFGRTTELKQGIDLNAIPFVYDYVPWGMDDKLLFSRFLMTNDTGAHVVSFGGYLLNGYPYTGYFKFGMWDENLHFCVGSSEGIMLHNTHGWINVSATSEYLLEPNKYYYIGIKGRYFASPTPLVGYAPTDNYYVLGDPVLKPYGDPWPDPLTWDYNYGSEELILYCTYQSHCSLNLMGNVGLFAKNR